MYWDTITNIFVIQIKEIYIWQYVALVDFINLTIHNQNLDNGEKIRLKWLIQSNEKEDSFAFVTD